MGRNYSFILITNKENKKSIENFINAGSDEKYNLDTDKDLSVTFPKDSAVSAYLHEVYPDPVERKKSLIKDGSKVSIGCIWFREEVLENSDIARYDFTAATNRMSDLFCSSSSVRDWFAELGKASGALAVYFDMEYVESIIYSDSEKTSVFFEDDYYIHISPDRFCETIVSEERRLRLQNEDALR